MNVDMIVKLVLLLLVAAAAYPLYRVARTSTLHDRVGIAIALVLTIVIPFVPRSVEVRQPGQDAISRVIVVAPELYLTLLVLLLGATLLLALSGALQQRRTVIVTGVLWTLCAMVMPCVNLRRAPGPWKVEATAQHPNHQTYAFLSSHDLERQRMLLTRLVEEPWYGSVFQVLGNANTDDPRAYLLVVRPESQERVLREQLLLAADGRVVVVRALNEAPMIYNPATQEFRGRETVRSASPFLLLGERTTPSRKDVNRILSAMENSAEHATQRSVWLAAVGRGEVSGVPLESELVLGLEHRNPAVRSVARQLLDKYKQLTQTLTQASDELP